MVTLGRQAPCGMAGLGLGRRVRVGDFPRRLARAAGTTRTATTGARTTRLGGARLGGGTGTWAAQRYSGCGIFWVGARAGHEVDIWRGEADGCVGGLIRSEMQMAVFWGRAGGRSKAGEMGGEDKPRRAGVCACVCGCLWVSSCYTSTPEWQQQPPREGGPPPLLPAHCPPAASVQPQRRGRPVKQRCRPCNTRTVHAPTPAPVPVLAPQAPLAGFSGIHQWRQSTGTHARPAGFQWPPCVSLCVAGPPPARGRRGSELSF